MVHPSQGSLLPSQLQKCLFSPVSGHAAEMPSGVGVSGIPNTKHSTYCWTDMGDMACGCLECVFGRGRWMVEKGEGGSLTLLLNYYACICKKLSH